MKAREYPPEFIAQVKDYAVMGLRPRQIAERLNLEGAERRDFLLDIASKGGPLYEAFLQSRAHGEEDPHATLVTLADGGDTDALELLTKVTWQERVDNLKAELFGI